MDLRDPPDQLSNFIDGKTERKGGQETYLKLGLNNFDKLNRFLVRFTISSALVDFIIL